MNTDTDGPGAYTDMVIGFSYHYTKIHGQTSAELIDVREIELPEPFDGASPLVGYDTEYIGSGGRRETYPLKGGRHMQLIFIGNMHIPFCTLRDLWSDGVYMLPVMQMLVGKIFRIKYKGE